MIEPRIPQFVGRGGELRRITELLAPGGPRLITLLGPGGIGKTSLATEALRRYQRPGRDRVLWVRLARLETGSDVEAIVEEIVRTVAPTDLTGRRAEECLVDAFIAFESQRPILVLDNCEHVLNAVARLAVELLTLLPEVTVVATSREPIGWTDERLVPVQPLTHDHALELFRRRAELTGRPIPDDPATLDLAARICRHVDNNPLFIRLAAARLRYRPAAELLRDLTGAGSEAWMGWSSGVRAGDEERHRSVGDVIAWSYGLCSAPERLLLDRMSVFAAGFDPGDDEIRCGGVEHSAITAVCADAELPESMIEVTLQRLVERSLVSTRMTTTAVGYFLPESVRVFARTRLRERPDEPEALSESRLLARHRRYFRDKVVAGRAMWYGPDELQWINWARAAWDDVLLAVESSLSDPGEAVIGLEIVTVAMALRVPFLTGTNRAVGGLAERALAVVGDDPELSALRISAKALIGWIAVWQGRFDYTARLLNECAAECLTDPVLQGEWRDYSATDIGLPAEMEFTWGLELFLIHLDLRSIDVLSRAREKFAAAGDRGGRQRSELFTVLAAASLAPPETAEQVVRGHLEDAAKTDAVWAMSWAEFAVLVAASRYGDPEDAVRRGREAVAQHLERGDTWTAGWIIHYSTVALATTLTRRTESGARSADLAAAAREIAYLQGGTAALHRSMGIASDRVPLVIAGSQAARVAATAVLGPQRYAAALRRGTRLRPEDDELQRYFLGRLSISDRDDADPNDVRWQELSPAERDIAILVAAGWTNSAVAMRRGTSVRTVDAQVATIRRKLAAADRSAIIDRIPAELRERVGVESRQPPGRWRKTS
ncbi:ATP-binding protein [Nocardia spumae]|uniref:ATP-binding protein n=1 Tax=Nocardia spumae TaxID=2887190 RepID=UPI001D14C872|nr:AAA family ATPase [Nocardia spumae]